MTRPDRSPLEGVERLIIDGNNLLHAGTRSKVPLPASAVIGRLRAAIPARVRIELVFDGPPEPGIRGERIAAGLVVRHAGRRSADQLIVSLVDFGHDERSAAGAENALVVTDDRELRDGVRALGAKTARPAWLLERLARGTLQAPALGNARAPRPARPPTAVPDREDPDAPGWQPGRGATTKRGNPRRGHPRPGYPPKPERQARG